MYIVRVPTVIPREVTYVSVLSAYGGISMKDTMYIRHVSQSCRKKVFFNVSGQR